MHHEIGYRLHDKNQQITSTLVVKGEDNLHTAMAKTVGLPLAIGAKLLLQNKIHVTGLHIPIIPQIYEPVLAELEKEQIIFKESA